MSNKSTRTSTKEVKITTRRRILSEEGDADQVPEVNPKRSIMFEDNDVEPAPEANQSQPKKMKKPDEPEASHKRGKMAEGNDVEQAHEAHPPHPKRMKRSEKEHTWTLSDNRQARVRKYRGSTLIDIREYYSKNGRKRAGKRSVSLKPEPWNKLMELAPEISAAVQHMEAPKSEDEDEDY